MSARQPDSFEEARRAVIEGRRKANQGRHTRQPRPGRFVHGRCAVGRKCRDAGVIFRWPAGTLKVKDARCPTCGLKLHVTAPSRSLAEVRDVPPPEVA